MENNYTKYRYENRIVWIRFNDKRFLRSFKRGRIVTNVVKQLFIRTATIE